MLWAALSLHIFSVVIWLGSLCFLSAILYPVLEVEKQSGSEVNEHLHRRLMPFLWLSLWTIGITGVALYIFLPDFIYGREFETWLIPVHGKIVLFIFIIIFSMRTNRIYAMYRKAKTNSERAQYLLIIARTIRITILIGIVTVLLAAWEAISTM